MRRFETLHEEREFLKNIIVKLAALFPGATLRTGGEGEPVGINLNAEAEAGEVAR